MRKLSIVVVTVLLVAATAASAGSIVNTKHNFTSFATPYDAQICRPCHTPHNGQVNTYAPLWNHAATTATYTLYSSNTGTMNATLAQPVGLSKACLSCHDGTVAVDNYPGGAATHFIAAGNTANFGSDLSNDHPIGFTYNAALATADGELYNPTTTSAGLAVAGNINARMLFGPGNDQLECASCHDVHGTSTPAGVNDLLLKTNAASALCLTCHNK